MRRVVPGVALVRSIAPRAGRPSAGAAALLAALDRLPGDAVPAGSEPHPRRSRSCCAGDVTFLAAWRGRARRSAAARCAHAGRGRTQAAAYGEIKRMFVRPGRARAAHRRAAARSASKRRSREQRYSRALLETGARPARGGPPVRTLRLPATRRVRRLSRQRPELFYEKRLHEARRATTSNSSACRERFAQDRAQLDARWRRCRPKRIRTASPPRAPPRSAWRCNGRCASTRPISA